MKRTAVLASLGAVLAAPSTALAAEGSERSAGGAEIGQVILATAMGLTATAVLALLVAGHRTGRIPLFGRLAQTAEGVSGLRGWSALPGTVLIGALLIAVFGMYWDVATHLDNGRDPGPLANPSHYFILLGLFGVLFAGVMAMALPLKDGGKAEVRLPNGWRAPAGAILIAACGAFSLSAFPLDDVWHRLFGQDVTLWGPTHLMLIGGAALSVIGAWMLQVEGLRGRLTREVEGLPTWTRVREVFLAGALLIGLSTFQDEFDMGIPQFRMVFHPILLMLAAGVALVAARIRIGRGGALGAVAVFILVRGLLSLVVGPVFGYTQPHFPLYVVEALVVEAVALRFAVERRPLAFGAAAGVGIGTVGLAAEWGWSHVWMVNPWTEALLPEGAILGFVTALAAGEVIATVRLDPPDAADDAIWLNVTGWQGKGSVIEELREVGPGTYETPKPVPVHGNWKSTIRLHRDDQVLGMPLFLPEDRAIPVKEVPASPQFTREFVFDKKNLQREQKAGVAGWLTTAGYLAVLVLALALVALIVWGLRRVERVHSISPGEPPKPAAGRASPGTGRVAPAS